MIGLLAPLIRIISTSCETACCSAITLSRMGVNTLQATTLGEAKQLFATKQPDFCLTDIHQAAATDPKGFLAQLPDGAILNEIQRLPELLSYIQGVVDAKQKPSMFILTGNHQPNLHHAVTGCNNELV